MNWSTIATVALTATTTILATCGVVTAEESTSLTTAGGAAITGVASLITAIVSIVQARKAAQKAEEQKAE